MNITNFSNSFEQEASKQPHINPAYFKNFTFWAADTTNYTYRHFAIIKDLSKNDFYLVDATNYSFNNMATHIGKIIKDSDLSANSFVIHKSKRYNPSNEFFIDYHNAKESGSKLYIPYISPNYYTSLDERLKNNIIHLYFGQFDRINEKIDIDLFANYFLSWKKNYLQLEKPTSIDYPYTHTITETKGNLITRVEESKEVLHIELETKFEEIFQSVFKLDYHTKSGYTTYEKKVNKIYLKFKNKPIIIKQLEENIYRYYNNLEPVKKTTDLH